MPIRYQSPSSTGSKRPSMTIRRPIPIVPECCRIENSIIEHVDRWNVPFRLFKTLRLLSPCTLPTIISVGGTARCA